MRRWWLVLDWPSILRANLLYFNVSRIQSINSTVGSTQRSSPSLKLPPSSSSSSSVKFRFEFSTPAGNPAVILMENVLNVPPKSPIQPENTIIDCKTPPLSQQSDQNHRNPGNDLRKPSTPDRLKVPKAFKYPERYRSPTDSMMSPVTKGLLARSRKGGVLLPPSKNQTKIQDLRVQEVGLFEN